MLKGKKALLFDLDGTLLDSMGIWSDIDVRYLGRFGIERPDDLERTVEGMSFIETAHYFKERFELKDSIEKILSDWRDMALDEYKDRIPMKPGARNFLHRMHEAGMKMAITTSNAEEMTRLALRRFGVEELFEQIVTTADVAHSKPAPDVYLRASELLGIAPEECLVFEDIPAGIRAGKSAGMQVCAVKDAYSQDQRETILSLADYFVEDYDQVLDGSDRSC